MRNALSPRVNLNGTDAQALYDQQNSVVFAARVLLDALAKATPHGRDYQTVDPNFGVLARSTHLERIKQVEAIRDEAEYKCLDIYDQADRKIRVS